ncbi:PTS sugar transporter subunit IIA [Planctomycetales bacterium ZRK34]|nr:PTS sugar transporter subunit IIA [Planctomycetales bacterium ZRK34]
MKLSEHIRPDLVWVLDTPGSRDALLRELSGRVSGAVTSIDAEALYKSLLEREAKGPTATPEGVALPHAMMTGTEENFIAVALVRGGCEFQSPRVKKIDLVFMLVGPQDKAWQHIRVLARLARICHDPTGLERLRAADSGEDLFKRLLEEDARHV